MPIASILNNPIVGKENAPMMMPPLAVKGPTTAATARTTLPSIATITAPMNFPPTPASAPGATTTAATKRKFIPMDETDEDYIMDNYDMDQNCDQVRRKINRFLDAAAMTKTAFCKTIGVSAKSLNNFLAEHGPHKGYNSSTYGYAWAYFKRRELAGLKLPNKKQKTDPTPAPSSASSAAPTPVDGATTATATATASLSTTAMPKRTSSTAPSFNSAGVDISDITLPGEDTDEVPVFDSCDEVRRKLNLHLKRPGVTQAQFCRDMVAQLHAKRLPAKGIQGSQLARFRGMKGPSAGAGSVVFYAAYVFFEKLRIKEGKPKTKHRLTMEETWGPEGFELESDRGRCATIFFSFLFSSPPSSFNSPFSSLPFSFLLLPTLFPSLASPLPP